MAGIIRKKYSSPGIQLKGCNVYDGGNSNDTDALPSGGYFIETLVLQPLLYRFETGWTFTVFPSPAAVDDHIGGVNQALQLSFAPSLGLGYNIPVYPDPVPSFPMNISESLGYQWAWRFTTNIPFGGNRNVSFEDSAGASFFFPGGWNFDPNGHPAGTTYGRTRTWALITTVSGTYLDPEELTVLTFRSNKLITKPPNVTPSGATSGVTSVFLGIPIKHFCNVITQYDSNNVQLHAATSGLTLFSRVSFDATEWTTEFTPGVAVPGSPTYWDNGNGAVSGIGDAVNLDGYRLNDNTDNTWILACPNPLNGLNDF